MMNDQRYSTPLELKASGSAGIVEGYASTFGGPPDAFGDIIAPGAFRVTLQEHRANKTSPALLWAHDQTNPIGKFLDLAEDNHGLHVRGKLTLSVPQAHDAFELAKDGALAFSIGFGVVRQSEDGKFRVIEEAKLGEVSLVAMPANSNARITNVKSLSSIVEYQSFLHDLGLSVREAKRLARGGWCAFRGEAADEADLAEFLRASAFRIKGI